MLPRDAYDSEDDPLLLLPHDTRPLKRRRIAPSPPSSEVVESSDVDEREQEASKRADYWTSGWTSLSRTTQSARHQFTASTAPPDNPATTVIPSSWDDEESSRGDLAVPSHYSTIVGQRAVGEDVIDSLDPPTPTRAERHPTVSPITTSTHPQPGAFRRSATLSESPIDHQMRTRSSILRRTPLPYTIPDQDASQKVTSLSPFRTPRHQSNRKIPESPLSPLPRYYSSPGSSTLPLRNREPTPTIGFELDDLATDTLAFMQPPPDTYYDSPAAPRFILSQRRRASFDNSIAGTPNKLSSATRARSDPPPASSPPRHPSSPPAIPLDPEEDFFAPRRALRQRTAIQLNPYTTEARMYKAILVRAGAKDAVVKNSRVVSGQAESGAEGRVEEDSQEREWEASQAIEEESQTVLQRQRRSISRERSAPVPRRRTPPSSKAPLVVRGRTQAVRRVDKPPSPLLTSNRRHRPANEQAVRQFVDALGGGLSDDDDDDTNILSLFNQKSKPITYTSTSRIRKHSTPEQSSSSRPSPVQSSVPSSPTAAPQVSSAPRFTASTPPYRSSSSSPAADLDFRMLPIPNSRRQPPKETALEPIVIASDSDDGFPGPGQSRRRERSSTLGRKDKRKARSPEQSSGDNDSDDEERDLTEHQRKIDLKRKKALVRVLPQFMIKKLEADARRKERHAAERDEESSDEGGPVPAEDVVENSEDERESDDTHRGRIRRVPNPGGRLDIQGDPESSPSRPQDPALSPPRYDVMDLDEQSDDGTDGTVDLRQGLYDDVIAFSEESTRSEDDDVLPDDITSWLERPVLASRKDGPRAGTRASPPPRDGDLIDRMLSRHVDFTGTRKRKSTRSGGSKRSTTSKPRRRKGQTTLHSYVSKTTSHQRPKSSAVGHSEHNWSSSHRKSHSSNKIHHDFREKGNAGRQTHLKSRTSSHKQPGVSIHWSTNHNRSTAATGEAAMDAIPISDDDGTVDDQYGTQEDLFSVLRPENAPAVRSAPAPQRAAPVHRHKSKGGSINIPRNDIRHSAAVPDLREYSSALSRKGARDSLIDFGISSLPTGSSFDSSTYIGSGRLAKLLDALPNPPIPLRPLPSGDLDCSLTITELEDRLPTLFDALYGWVTDQSVNESEQHHGSMRFICEYASWLAHDPDPVVVRDKQRFLLLVLEQVQHLMGRLTLATSGNSERIFWVMWFSVECSLRAWSTQVHSTGVDVVAPSLSETLGTGRPTSQYLNTLMLRLHDHGFQGFDVDVDVPIARKDLRNTTAELWICCLNLILVADADTVPQAPLHDPFWNRAFAALENGDQQHGLELSEKMWRCIMGMIVLSKFNAQGVALSSPKLPACWPLVVQALSAIRLEGDKEKDSKTAASVLQKRDAYIRLVLARCLLLVTRWHWNLCGADALFKPLTSIFRSRKFENLRGEISDFPVFLRDVNEEAYLEAYDKKETSFGIFLKLILYAARDYENDVRGAANGQKQVRKLASLIFPIGATPFSKDNPPVGRELSMLFNRFAAVVVVIHLEPSNAKLRVQQARRFLDFKQAEYNSRTAGIRGMMLIGVAHRRKDLDMSEVMAWFSEMATVLLGDLRDIEKQQEQGVAGPANLKSQISLLVILLVGALRKMVETPCSGGTVMYPDPILLEEACLDKIMQSPLAMDVRTNVEIRKLIQTFLETRTIAVGPRYISEQPVIGAEQSETQESSDEFGSLKLDWNDPNLLAALGEGEKTPQMVKEERVARVMRSTLSPAIFRFIQRHFGDLASSGAHHESGVEKGNVDGWIECWVSCIEVLVRNNFKEWSQYRHWGDESLDRITDHASRRMIEGRFLLAVLRVDPTAYTGNSDWFVTVLLTSLVAIRFGTQETEYVSAVLNANGQHHHSHQHPLLVNLPCVAGENGSFAFEVRDLEELRLPMLRAVTRNLVSVVRKPAPNAKDKQSIAAGIEGVVSILAAMKDNCERAKEDGPYFAFCREFVNHLKSSTTTLWEEARIASAASWISQ